MAENKIEYFEIIQGAYLKTDNQNTLTAKDWILIDQWHQRDIPSEVICRGIEKCFTENDSKLIDSLGFCRYEIEEEAKLWNDKDKPLFSNPKEYFGSALQYSLFLFTMNQVSQNVMGKPIQGNELTSYLEVWTLLYKLIELDWSQTDQSSVIFSDFVHSKFKEYFLNMSDNPALYE